jgi:hypothetical protein
VPAPADAKPAVGILANPVSGWDVRRIAARASTSTLEDKRAQVARVALGAVAAGARRIVVMREPFRVSTGALETIALGAAVEALDVGARVRREDSERAAAEMCAAGCAAVVALGGDGTSRAIARAWRDVPLVALSTGTNNVFPTHVEAGLAGAAAGLVAAGALAAGDVARASKLVRVEIEGEEDDVALVDATLLADDRVGNLLPFDPERLRHVVLARAEPAAVGSSPIGGLLLPAGADDDFGVAVECAPASAPGRTLRVPLSPGLWCGVRVAGFRRLAFGEPVRVRGPGVLALDGDRERALAPGQHAVLTVERAGPRVIDVRAALAAAGRRGLFEDGRE